MKKRVNEKSRPLVDFSLIVASLLISVFLCELIVRHVAPQHIRPTYQISNAQLNYQLRPNSKWFVEGATGEYRADCQTNEHGWRMGPLDSRKKIMVLGDSFTFGFSVSQDQIYPAVVERQLEREKRPHQLVNLGVEGYSPAEYWASYRYNKQKVEAKLVLLAFFEGNDYIEGSPLISEGQDFTLRSMPSITVYDNIRKIMQSQIYDFLAQHSHLATLIKNALYVALKGNGDVDQSVKPSALDFTTKTLLAIAREVLSDDRQFLVMIVPAPHYPRPTDELVRRLSAAGIQVLDLRPAFPASSIETYYHIRDDGHWNAQGHERAGSILTNWLLKESLLDSE